MCCDFPRARFFLTRNNLQNSVLLHIGRKVPRSHVLLHYPHVCQFLGRNQTKGANVTELRTKVNDPLDYKLEREVIKYLIYEGCHFRTLVEADFPTQH